MASTDGKDYVRGTAGDDDIRITNNPAGSILVAGDGDDIVRGGKYNDILIAGSGNDVMAGGAGADQFRFYGDDIGTATDFTDTDKIYDLTFSEGDTLVFGAYAAGTFTDIAGVNAFHGGSDASISSWLGVVNAVNGSSHIGAVRQSPYNDNLTLILHSGAYTQEIVISNGWTAYVNAGGVTDAVSA